MAAEFSQQLTCHSQRGQTPRDTSGAAHHRNKAWMKLPSGLGRCHIQATRPAGVKTSSATTYRLMQWLNEHRDRAHSQKAPSVANGGGLVEDGFPGQSYMKHPKDAKEAPASASPGLNAEWREPRYSHYSTGGAVTRCFCRRTRAAPENPGLIENLSRVTALAYASPKPA